MAVGDLLDIGAARPLPAAELEFRFSREWKLQSSVEPTIQSCNTFVTTNRLSTNPYQIGLDILWEREF